VLKGERPSNLAALRNPGSLAVIVDRVNEYDSRAASFETVGAQSGSVEDELKAIWERVLGVSPIGLDDDFFESGGTSLLTAPLFQQIADRLGRRLPLSTILSAPTISLLAALLREDPSERWPVLVMLKPGATQRPLFVAPPLTGEILGLLPVAVRIETDRAVYGIRGRGLVDGEQPLDTIEKMAEVYCQNVRSMQPHGPYALIGYSLGGQIAFEMARRFTADGEEVEFLGLIDTISPWASLTVRERLVAASRLPGRWPRVALPEFQRAVARVRKRFGPQNSSEGYRRMMGVQRAAASALKTYRPRSLDVRGVFYQASHLRAFQADPTVLWSRLVRRGLRVEPISGYHDALMHDPHVGVLAAAISRTLPSDRRPSAIGRDQVNRSRRKRW
jgi:acetoacetyl-CoA synthetase